MNTVQIIASCGVLTSTLLACGFMSSLYAKLHAERAKRIEAIQQLMEARAERDERQETATRNLSWAMAFRRSITDQDGKLDSLMNGDRRCVEGHRYHTGQGIRCPWCGAAEVVTTKQRWPALTGIEVRETNNLPRDVDGILIRP